MTRHPSTLLLPFLVAIASAATGIVFTRAGDRWVQQAHFKASNPGSNDQFGHMVAISGDGNIVAASAPFEDSRATGVNGDQKSNSMPKAGAV